jgi:hypothetical protein
MLATMHGPSEDHFADNLKIPTDIPEAEPEAQAQAAPGPGGPEDTFQAALMAALQNKGSADPLVEAKLDALLSLQKNAPDILQRYLATSPAWRVYEEFGRRYATRRWTIGQGDHATLALGFSGYLPGGLQGGDRRATHVRPGATAKVLITAADQWRYSRCVMESTGLAVEIAEWSATNERRLTKAILAGLEAELRPLAAAPNQATLLRILPAGSIRRGAPSLELARAGESGIYRTELWVHAGEPGCVYLKAFEVTHGTPLATDFLKKDSNAWIGWSDDPAELFYSTAKIVIGEGDPGKPYAARFEVWFAPASGRPRRKLLEKVFKITGYKF